MKKFIGRVFGIAIVFLGVPFVAAADALPVPVHLTVQTFDQTLFDADVSVDPCFNSQFGPTTTVNAFCAVSQVASSSGWTLNASWSQYGVFVNSINAYAPTSLSGPYWLYYANGESALTGLDAHMLTPGEHILLTFGISPLRVVVATTTPLTGTTTLLHAQYFDTTSIFDWVNATGTTFIVNGVPMLSDTNGTLLYTPLSTDPVSVIAEEPGYVTSMPVTLTPYAASLPPHVSQGTTIHLDIETFGETLYNNDFTVYPCPNSQYGTTTSTNAFCAVDQVVSASGWTSTSTWFSFGKSLDGINAYVADFANGRYWFYYADREPGMTGLDSHILTPGEDLLLTFGVSPLRVVPVTTTPEVGTTTLLQAQYFDQNLFDWTNATTTTFMIDGVATTSDTEGKVILTPTSVTPFVVSVSHAGFVNSRALTITPIVTPPITTPPSGGASTPEVTHTIDISKAVQFLRSLQNSDGSFGAPLYTDWVAIGLGGITGGEDMQSKLRAYMTGNTNPGPLLTDAERRAMALLALGIDPAQGTSRNYIADIMARFDGTQFGDANEVNDDIFALIVLTHAGYDATDALIASDVDFIISKQSVDGSWGSIDMTAAGIEAFAPLGTLPGVTSAIDKAKGLLHRAQQDDGGYGSSFATSWVLTAINGMPTEDLVRDWKKGGRTPADYLWLLQQIDGGVGEASLSVNNRVWATAYALTGSSGTDWDAALESFPRGATRSPQVTHTGSKGEILGAATVTYSGGATGTTTTSVVSTSTLAVQMTSTSTVMLALSNSSSTSSATSTMGKAATTTSKSIGTKTKKKAIQPVMAKQTASVANVVPSVPPVTAEERKAESGIVSFIRDPFVRFFKFVSSLF